jgi:hypothetical protein
VVDPRSDAGANDDFANVRKSKQISGQMSNCKRCGGTRVVAVVLRSTTAQAILEHLRLPSRPLPFAPATSPQLGLCDCRPRFETHPGLTTAP